MWNFNLVVTLAANGHFQSLLRELSHCGEFHRTNFLGVLLGYAADPAAFLETVRNTREQRPGVFPDLGRVVPLERCFTFTAETFLDRLRDALGHYAGHLGGQSFYVRLERRGLKGRIVSPEVERSLDACLLKLAAETGNPARIDFDDPDTVLAVETIGDRCGIGVLTRELRARYPFVRVG